MGVSYSFVPLPRCIWDKCVQLTASEFRLLGYVMLQQSINGGAPVKMSDDELLRGRVRPGGGRMDGGCGVKGKNNLQAAKAGLQGFGWLKIDEQDVKTRWPDRYYSIDSSLWSDTDYSLESETDPQACAIVRNGPSDSPKRTVGQSETDYRIKDRARLLEDPNKKIFPGARPQEDEEGKAKREVPDTPHHRLLAAYQEALGYPIPSGAQEGSAAKSLIGRGHSIEDVIACYHHFKGTDFWADKHLSLQVVLKNIGAWKRAERDRAVSPNGRPSAENAKPVFYVAERPGERRRIAARGDVNSILNTGGPVTEEEMEFLKGSGRL